MKGSTLKRGATWTNYWFTTDPATGKRRQHSKGGFRTQRAAQSHLHGILDKVETGAWRPDAKLTVAQLLEDHWLPAHAAEGIRPRPPVCTATRQPTGSFRISGRSRCAPSPPLSSGAGSRSYVPPAPGAAHRCRPAPCR